LETVQRYCEDGPKNGLHINYDENTTFVFLGKCKDDAETQRCIATYFDRVIYLTNIKVRPENGGSEQDYSNIHLRVLVGSKMYQLSHLNSLVDKFIETWKCDEILEEAQSKLVGILTMGHSPKNSFLV
jgi:hypothetical protein